MKSFRYIAYVLPFFFILAAIAIDYLLFVLAGLVRGALAFAERKRWVTVPQRMRPTVTGGVLVLAATTAIFGNRAQAHGLKRLAQDSYRVATDPASLVREPPDKVWSTGASRKLRAAIGSPSLLVVGDDVRTIHYLGRPFDLLINRSRISDISPKVEFGRDFRTGRRVVGSGSTLVEVANCYPDGVILVPDDRWGVGYAVPVDLTAAIEGFARPVTPGVKGFHLYRWRHPVRGADCAKLKSQIENHAAQ